MIPAGFFAPDLVVCTAYDGELDAWVFEIGPITVFSGTSAEVLALADDWIFWSTEAWNVHRPVNRWQDRPRIVVGLEGAA